MPRPAEVPGEQRPGPGGLDQDRRGPEDVARRPEARRAGRGSGRPLRRTRSGGTGAGCRRRPGRRTAGARDGAWSSPTGSRGRRPRPAGARCRAARSRRAGSSPSCTPPAGEALPDQPRQVAAVVQVGVGEHDRVDPARRRAGLLPVAPAQRGPALVQPGVDQDPLPVEGDVETAAGHRVRGTQEGQDGTGHRASSAAPGTCGAPDSQPVPLARRVVRAQGPAAATARVQGPAGPDRSTCRRALVPGDRWQRDVLRELHDAAGPDRGRGRGPASPRRVQRAAHRIRSAPGSPAAGSAHPPAGRAAVGGCGARPARRHAAARGRDRGHRPPERLLRLLAGVPRRPLHAATARAAPLPAARRPRRRGHAPSMRRELVDR